MQIDFFADLIVRMLHIINMKNIWHQATHKRRFGDGYSTCPIQYKVV